MDNEISAWLWPGLTLSGVKNMPFHAIPMSTVRANSFLSEQTHFYEVSSSREAKYEVKKSASICKKNDKNPEGFSIHLNPLYTGGLFHCYTLDESISHFRGVLVILGVLGLFCCFNSNFGGKAY